MAAQRKGEIKGKDFNEWVQAGLETSLLTAQEADQLLKMNEARMSIINVDDFANEDIVRIIKRKQDAENLV